MKGLQAAPRARRTQLCAYRAAPPARIARLALGIAAGAGVDQVEAVIDTVPSKMRNEIWDRME